MAAIVFLIAVNCTNPVNIQTNLTLEQHVYQSINQTTKTDPLTGQWEGFVKQKNNTDVVVLPVATAAIALIKQDRVNNTIAGSMHARGLPNVNPYYGQGFVINWTPINTTRFVYNYYYTNLANVSLTHICTRDCYCRLPC